MSDREHDVVIYGATGFVGKLTAKYLAGAAPDGARIALGGRSEAKLRDVRNSLGEAAAKWPVVVADSSDAEAVERLARSTSAVATTVGPYARYGHPLVAACAAAGTHYCDLTGEVLFVRESAARHHRAASDSGSRIVHSCGYDSIPSDLGVLMLHRLAESSGSGTLGDTVHQAWGRGGFSGGTIDSLRNQIDTVKADASLRRILADPYSLSPDRAAEPNLGAQPDVFPPHRDPVIGQWVGPFVMAPFNTRIVRRSNALLGWQYGRSFAYREVMAFGASPAGAALAAGVTGAVVGMAAAMAFPPSRRLLDRVLPAPGEGPSQQTMDRGSFRSDFYSVTSSGRKLHAVVAASGDPGYKATAVMLGESALALSLDGERLPDGGGVLTPATGIGDTLVERLRAAGFTMTTD